MTSPIDITSSDFNANRISPARPLSVTSPAPRVVRIVRAPGTGLGISIAGGRGSVPFIGTDEVMSLLFLLTLLQRLCFCHDLLVCLSAGLLEKKLQVNFCDIFVRSRPWDTKSCLHSWDVD